MAKLRKVEDGIEARVLLAKVDASGGDVGACCRAHGFDGRSLNAWRANLARGRAPGRGRARPAAATKAVARLRLVELVPTTLTFDQVTKLVDQVAKLTGCPAPVRSAPEAARETRETREGEVGRAEPLAVAVRYYKNHERALLRFLEDPLIPIDNSATERELQNVAKLRLNMLFAGSTEGAHRACVLLGIVATCRAIGVPAQAYVAWALDRLGTLRDVFALDLEQITPAAFKRTLG